MSSELLACNGWPELTGFRTTLSPTITCNTNRHHLRHQQTSHRGFRAQRFYLNLLPVLGFLHNSTDLDEPDKPATSVFLISQHRKCYKPSKNGAICACAYLLCAQRFYRSAVFYRTSVQTLIALCVRSLGHKSPMCQLYRKSSLTSWTKVLSAAIAPLCTIIFGCTNIYHLDGTFVQTLIAPCIADRLGTKVLCANFVANSILQHAHRFYQAR